MINRQFQDPQAARFIRKQHKNQGSDQQQQQQDNNFNINLSKTLKKYQKHRTERNLQNQVKYFGNIIEPFNMRQQQQMGQIDQQGFFVFNRNKKNRDPWLQSIGQDDDGQIADQLIKKIKTESRFQSVYEANEQINRNLSQNQQSQEQQNAENKNSVSQSQQSPKQQKQPNTPPTTKLIQLMIELIPQHTNANTYMKKLKKQNKLDEYNQLLSISNQYIQKTNQYDILTKKKNQLQDLLDSILYQQQEVKQLQHSSNKSHNQQQIINWNDDDNQPQNHITKHHQQQIADNNQSQNQQQQSQQNHKNTKNRVQQNQSDSQSSEQDQDNFNID